MRNPLGTTTGLSGSNALFAPNFNFANLIAPNNPKVFNFATTPVVNFTIYFQNCTDVTLGSGAGAGVFGNALGYVAGKPVQELPFQQPLWQIAGFPADPRGNVDIGILTTATNAVASPVIGMRVTYLANVAG